MIHNPSELYKRRVTVKKQFTLHCAKVQLPQEGARAKFEAIERT
jgi:hypothetical protein